MTNVNSKPRKTRVWPVDVSSDVTHHSHGVLDEEVFVMKLFIQRRQHLRGGGGLVFWSLMVKLKKS